MHRLKFMLTFVLGAVYASGWWAAARFGWDKSPYFNCEALWAFAIISNVALAGFCIGYLIINWDKP